MTQFAVNLASSLSKLGVRKGEIVAVGSEKRNEYLPIVLAIMFTGATYTSHDLNSGTALLKHKINITQPKYYIVSQNFLDRYKEVLANYDCVKMLLTIDDEFDKVKSLKCLVKDDVDIQLFDPVYVSGQSDVAYIMYSSGTTGLTKGVQITHLNCILQTLTNDFSDDSLKTALTLGDWHHSYCLLMSYKFLILGRKILYAEIMNYSTILCSITDYQANILFIVPNIINLLAKECEFSKHNLDSLKIMYSVGSPIDEKTIDKVKQRFPNLKNVLKGYGMTEVDIVTSECWGHKGPKPGSVGRASPGITLKISDLETGKTLGPYKHGEICLKTSALMKGYIGIDLSNDLDKEGFFRTGDLGYYDEDSYFYIVGRLKELIDYDGYHIPPLELETFLQLHPGVAEAGVVGKSVPDIGEVPTAFVVKQPGAVVTEQELVDYIAKEVAPYMQLRGGVKFIEEIPRSPGGKILRQKLKYLLDLSTKIS